MSSRRKQDSFSTSSSKSHSSKRMPQRPKRSLRMSIEEYILDHKSQNHSPQTISWHTYALGNLANFLEGDEMQLQPSEIHLCADIAGWSDIETLDRRKNFVTRSRKRTLHAEPEWGYDASVNEHAYGLRETGFDFSKHGPMSCVIYNKSHEIEMSGKTWFLDLWESRGYDPSKHGAVWRDEFRFKREALRELKTAQFHGLEDAYELPDRLEVLWAYAAGRPQGDDNGEPDGWLRCVIPTEDKNRGRWPTHPAWTVIQSAFTNPSEPPENFGKIIRKAKEDRNIEKAVEAMLGYATSAAAWAGGDLAKPDTDLSIFLHWLMQRAEKLMRRKDLDFGMEVQRKRVKFNLQPAIQPKPSTDDDLLFVSDDNLDDRDELETM